jgi:hypothetical protein
MEKYSHLATRIAATKDVFEKEVWPQIKTHLFGSDEKLHTLMAGQINQVKAAYEKNMLKDMNKKFGKSVYVPHQSTKECQRRVKQNASRT